MSRFGGYNIQYKKTLSMESPHKTKTQHLSLSLCMCESKYTCLSYY